MAPGLIVSLFERRLRRAEPDRRVSGRKQGERRSKTDVFPEPSAEANKIRTMPRRENDCKKTNHFVKPSAAALLGACATQPPKPAATPVEMTECIALAAPAAKAGATINEALAARRSWREFGPEKLSLEELSGVLWAAAGENRTDGKLTAPSALALYPITVYAVFEEGIYRYDGREQTLTRVAEGDHRAAAGRQPFVATAPLNLVYIADLQTYEGKGIPEENVLMLCAMDAAGYAENVNLYTAGHALRSITRGSAAADELLSLLRLDPARYRFILAQSVGK